MDSTTSDPNPGPVSNVNGPPPFLWKTYDMVDDPSSDEVVSWGSGNDSFVVWNPPEFAKNLLPKYFKHDNFSSFVRQLNTYGFRKVDPDHWEFANEGFLRGKKHLLKTITRRKAAHGHSHQHQQQEEAKAQNSVGPCVEVGKFGLEEEVERLTRDKNVLMQELVRRRQQQQATDSQLQALVQRVQEMEQRQQQMMSFLAKAVHYPGFFTQFVQKQNESNRVISEANKKRRLKQDDVTDSEIKASSDGQIVKYQPLVQVDSFNSDIDDFYMADSSNGVMEIKSPPNLVSGVSLQEVPPASVLNPSLITASSEVRGFVNSEAAPSSPLLQRDTMTSELTSIPNLEEGNVDNQENYLVTETGDDNFVDWNVLDGLMSIDFDDQKHLFDTSILEPFPDRNIIPIDNNKADFPQAENLKEKKESLLEKGWKKPQNIEQLIEQMGFPNLDSSKIV